MVIPADPNQTDRAIRHVAGTRGNFMVGMGRSKVPVICGEDGAPLFSGAYRFIPGRADLVRDGTEGAVFTFGGMLHRALIAWEKLLEKGIRVKIFNLPTPAEPDIHALKDGASTGLVVTYEDHCVHTGMGSCIGDALAAHGLAGVSFVKMGVSEYAGSGSPDELYLELGLSPDHLVETVERNLKSS